MKTTTMNAGSISVAAVALLALIMATSCVDTRQTIRQIDQHPGGDFNTVETSDERVVSVPFIYEEKEYLGILFWNCQQSEERLVCDRICDERWTDDRICRPDLHHEFGQITRPGSGVVSAKYQARVQELEDRLAERDDGKPADDESEDVEEPEEDEAPREELADEDDAVEESEEGEEGEERAEESEPKSDLPRVQDVIDDEEAAEDGETAPDGESDDEQEEQ